MEAMQPANLAAERTPMWAWALGLLPWVWIVPFNQYFWDDWFNASVTSWTGQVNRWGGGAGKHYLNPVTFFLLQSVGPWAFHLVTVLSSVVTAIAVKNILVRTRFLSRGLVQWAAPIVLSVPLFHARFSAATLEYSLALAALFTAWGMLLVSRSPRQLAGSFLLLAFAIGVPSLAIVFPFIWLSVSWKMAESRSPRTFTFEAFRYSYILAIPVVFSVIFRIFVNTSNRFKIFDDGLTDFNNDLVRMTFVFGIVLSLIFVFRRSVFVVWTRVFGTSVLAYIALFPYFAAGYKPLWDFMPWKMREQVKIGVELRLVVAFVLLSAIGLGVYVRQSSGVVGRWNVLALLCISSSVLFGVATFVLGPMDWDSRHWLIAWPAIAVTFLSLVETAPKSLHPSLANVMFVVLATASCSISSEYLIDSLKQKAIVSAAESDLREFALEQTSNGGEVLVVINPTQTMSNLNARFRSYRPYEWWGLLAKGMTIQPSQLKVLELGDVVGAESTECPGRYDAIRISPEISTGRLRALTTFRVQLDLNPEPVVLCSKVVREGWPRDPLP